MRKKADLLRIIALLLLVCLTVSLVACTPADDPNKDPGTTDPSPDQTTTDSGSDDTDPTDTDATGTTSGDTDVSDTGTAGNTPTDTTNDPSGPNDPVEEYTTNGNVAPNNPNVKKIAVLSGAGASTKIYSKMVEMTGKTNPNCLVITTAGKDGVDTIESYGNTMKKYTSNVKYLTLCIKEYTPAELRELIVEWPDMILEVGGQSEFMDEVWDKFGLPPLLTEAYNNGVVICGGSAGGMCWTYAGWNDFYELPESIYKWFYGIDVLHFYYGSHHHDNAQWTLFHDNLMALKDPVYPIGYAMDSGTGIVCIDGEVVEYLRENNKTGAFIWKYTFANGEWTRVKIEEYE